MTAPVTVQLRDPDAALAHGRDETAITRGALLHRAALGVGVLIGGGLLVRDVPDAFARASSDVDILNLLHLNESLQVSFYGEAVVRGGLRGRARAFARQVVHNETRHRNIARTALGAKARPLPPFDFGDATASEDRFLPAALAFESNDVGALNGLAPRLRSKRLLGVVAQMVSVEARQAAWIRRIAYGPTYSRASQYPASAAYDSPLTAAKLGAALTATGFVKGPV